MDEIDKPFRPKWDFFLVWAVLTVPAFVFRDRLNSGLPWYSVLSFVVMGPFLLTLFGYGPILLSRQIIKSGARGRYVAWHFVFIFVPTILVCGILLLTNHSDAAQKIALPLLFISIWGAWLISRYSRFGRI
jgi:hypothetical protein